MDEVRGGSATAEAWMTRRAQLNHDFLQNRVLGAVRASLSVSAGAGRHSLAPVLEAFVARRGEFRSLLANAPTALSPSEFLRRRIGDRLGEVDSAWLSAFLEREFLSLSEVPARAGHAKEDLETALVTAQRFLAGLETTEVLEAHLQRLSNTISSLPATPLAAISSMFGVER